MNHTGNLPRYVPTSPCTNRLSTRCAVRKKTTSATAEKSTRNMQMFHYHQLQYIYVLITIYPIIRLTGNKGENRKDECTRSAARCTQRDTYAYNADDE